MVDEIIAVEGGHVVAVHVWSTGARYWGVRPVGVTVLRSLRWATLLVLVLHRIRLWSAMVELRLWIAKAIVVMLGAVKETLS